MIFFLVIGTYMAYSPTPEGAVEERHVTTLPRLEGGLVEYHHVGGRYALNL